MKSRLKELSSILIKPAGPDCNMDCEYCFYLKKADVFPETKVHRMSDTILEETIRRVMTKARENVSFGWQGGEPTLMGLPFFEKAVAFQKKYGRGQTVGNGLQTNGILIDDLWTKFLREYNFLVGLSLDGPEHIHDHYRFMKSGRGSWSRVVDSAKRMLDGGVAINALTVVTDYSVRFPQEIYEFQKELGLSYMQFIPCVEIHSQDPFRMAPFAVPPEEYGRFLCSMFDLWIDDFADGVPTTSIRFFDSVLYNYVDLEPPECTLLPVCGIYVVVEYTGDVYSSDFFVESNWKLGNVMEGSISEMLNSDRQNEFGLMKKDHPESCRDCRWLKYCWGGCVKERIGNVNYLCDAYRMFFEHADNWFQWLAEEWKRQHSSSLDCTVA
ncbi:MAG: anaerobic sulfatase maturase [Gemmatimonadota bacterium]|nr:MAG: anaerobic sulfatase maturase [Gemmatimonadota bacterium]